jgi:hypothetical protein
VANEYPENVRREARRMWLTGRYTDEEMAAELKIPRADTIRDWRHQEGWVEIAKTIRGVIEDQVRVRVREEFGVFRSKYDQLGQAIENRAIRALNNPNLSTRDLRAIAGTLAQTQRIRDKALGGEAGQKADKLEGTVAGLVLKARERRAEEERRALGRCLGDGIIEADPSPPAEKGNTVTRGPDNLSGSPA